ncbi:hypothetical protein [Candidatus Phytoplasma phoenicium]|uniref:Uncharacterized protein n=1 Tax=Candidatus Phytoplasma phoenicium TaxID=198422 RepID=A0A0L0MKD2_9MOLU|nr:hypothetical protein [Candidatus Phytoplasma phoenicium]KND62736.1 hypothetical protein AlmWB_00820 [Candidatus Phytoplasma phoenicium]
MEKEVEKIVEKEVDNHKDYVGADFFQKYYIDLENKFDAKQFDYDNLTRTLKINLYNKKNHHQIYELDVKYCAQPQEYRIVALTLKHPLYCDEKITLFFDSFFLNQ